MKVFMKKLSLFLFIAMAFVFSGCVNFAFSDDDSDVINKKTVQVTINDSLIFKSARPDVSQFTGITYTVSAQEGVNTVTATKIGNVYQMLLSEGTWTVKVQGEKEGKLVVQAEQNVTVGSDGKYSLVMYPKYVTTGTGNIKLPVEIPVGYKVKVSCSTINAINSEIEIVSSLLEWSNVTAGSHTIAFGVYITSEGVDYPVYKSVQTVNVFANCTTDKWVKSSTSDFFITDDGKLKITAEKLNFIKDRTVYVSNSGNDSSGTGSYEKPYLTVDKAMQRIKALHAGTDTEEYTIFISGEVNLTQQIDLNLPLVTTSIKLKIAGVTDVNIDKITCTGAFANLNDNSLNVQDVTITGTSASNFFVVENCTNVKLTNVKMTNSYSELEIYVSNEESKDVASLILDKVETDKIKICIAKVDISNGSKIKGVITFNNNGGDLNCTGSELNAVSTYNNLYSNINCLISDSTINASSGSSVRLNGLPTNKSSTLLLSDVVASAEITAENYKSVTLEKVKAKQIDITDPADPVTITDFTGVYTGGGVPTSIRYIGPGNFTLAGTIITNIIELDYVAGQNSPSCLVVNGVLKFAESSSSKVNITLKNQNITVKLNKTSSTGTGKNYDIGLSINYEGSYPPLGTQVVTTDYNTDISDIIVADSNYYLSFNDANKVGNGILKANGFTLKRNDYSYKIEYTGDGFTGPSSLGNGFYELNYTNNPTGSLTVKVSRKDNNITGSDYLDITEALKASTDANFTVVLKYQNTALITIGGTAGQTRGVLPYNLLGTLPKNTYYNLEVSFKDIGIEHHSSSIVFIQ